MIKKITLILYIIVISLLLNLTAHAESETNYKFKEFYNLVKTNTEFSTPLIIDYSIEILKTNVDSMESMYIFSLLSRLSSNIEIEKQCNKLKEKYYNDLNDINTNLSEKIIMLWLLNVIDEKNNLQLYRDTLNNIKNNSLNKDYSALATILLLGDKANREENYEFFIKNFPDHKCIPLVELVKISDYYSKKEYNTCLDKCKNFIEKYKNIVSPFGWPVITDCYNLMFFCYYAINDHDNAKQCYDWIIKEAPNYDNIEQISQRMKMMSK